MAAFTCPHCLLSNNLHCNLSESCGFCHRPIFKHVVIIGHTEYEFETEQKFTGPMRCYDHKITGMEFNGEPVYLGRFGEMYQIDNERRVHRLYTDPAVEPEIEATRLAWNKEVQRLWDAGRGINEAVFKAWLTRYQKELNNDTSDRARPVAEA